MKDISAVLKMHEKTKEFTQETSDGTNRYQQKSLSGYENNVAEPDLQTFATLINLYGLSADEVLEITALLLLLFYFSERVPFLSTFSKLDFQHQEETLLLLRTLSKYLTQK